MPTAIETKGPKPLTRHLTPALDSAEKVRAYLEIAKTVLPKNLYDAMRADTARVIDHLQKEITNRVVEFAH